MSIYPCSFCRERHPGKMASAYWAWFLNDGARSAWKVRYCIICAGKELVWLFNASQTLERTTSPFGCWSCGSDAAGDSDPMYCTLYLPSKEPTELAVQLCGACAAKLRVPITTNGERLPDRGGVVRGPSPSGTEWDGFGPSAA